jgi:hypothetical protein
LNEKGSLIGHGKKAGLIGVLSAVVIVSVIVLSSLIALSVPRTAGALSVRQQQAPVQPVQNTVVSYGNEAVTNFSDFFGNFSGMTVATSFAHTDGSKTENTYSYSVIGMPLLNGIRTYEVNLTGTTSNDGQSSTESILIWISQSTGVVLQTHDGEMGYLTGENASNEGYVLSMITTSQVLSLLNSTTVRLDTPAQEFGIGSVQMEVTMYRSLPSFSLFQNWEVDVGTIQSRGIQLVTYSSGVVPSTGDVASFRIVSLMMAQSASN